MFWKIWFDMSFLYLDNNIIVNEISESRLPQLLKDGKFRLTISVWNLLELAKHGNKQEALRRACKIDSYNPVWLFNGLDIQADEITSFIWNEYYKGAYRAPRPFALCVSSILQKELPRERPIINGAKGLVKELQGNLKAIERADQTSLDANCTLQKKSKREKKEIEYELFCDLVSNRIKKTLPFSTPDQSFLKVQKIPELVDFCWKERKKFYKQCPSMAVEDCLTDIRARDSNRNPNLQDGRDLQHSIVSLPYCHVFITNDGYLHECTQYLSRKLSALKLAKVYLNLDSFLFEKG